MKPSLSLKREYRKYTKNLKKDSNFWEKKKSFRDYINSLIKDNKRWENIVENWKLNKGLSK